MTKKEHQHFIPKTYLKRFAHKNEGDNYFVDALDVNTFELKENIAVGNLCVDCDLYTLKKLSEDNKYKIEDFFNTEIESDYNDAYRILTDDSIEIISLEQRSKILKTIISMYFRTPKTLNQFVESSMELFKELKFKEKSKFSFMGVDLDLDKQSLMEIRSEIRENKREDFIKTNLLLLAEFMNLRKLDGIVVIKLIGDQEFITSDNPVTISNVKSQILDLFSLDNSIYVPISPKYCVFIAPTSEGAILNKIHRNHDDFLQHHILNESTFKNAEKWCIGTKKGIQKFKADQDEYSKPADENHPIIIKAKKMLDTIMELNRLVELAIEKNDFKELSFYINEHVNNDLFKKDASFIKLIKELKESGLLPPIN